MKAFSCENKSEINRDMTTRDFDRTEALRVVDATEYGQKLLQQPWAPIGLAQQSCLGAQ
ncbi:hypothetical protein OIDMADRAFT_20096 [Oidiodendron maius Zn]|uniref:Uncharacterized protein n=1 Tax=Oidiodendron maius (strain Zn) TaxID=913774 RepID=A0A0C3GR02_OIDMZ|nr:hypothetical protein OIDMADRAFT_20096 [Oidiodendron maius Zn]